MKQYMLSVHHTEGEPMPAEHEFPAIFKAVEEFNADITASGNWVFGGGLHPANTATLVRCKDGEVVTTDGPYAETKEQLGGFWVIKAADLDAALAIAARGAEACRNPVEVRPFQDDAED